MSIRAPMHIVAAAAAALCAVLLPALTALAQSDGARIETNASRTPSATETATGETQPPAAAPNSAQAAEPSGAKAPQEPAPGAAESGNAFEERAINGGPTGKEQGEGGWSHGLLDMLWPLLLVLAGIVVVFVLARRFLPGMKRMGGSPAIEVLARRYLSPRQCVNVIKLGRRILVVGQTSDQLSPLASISDPEEVSGILALCESSAEGSAAGSFRKIFQKMDREFDEPASGDAAGEAKAETREDDDLGRVRGELDRLRDKLRRLNSGRKE